jgi:hypothetical protein
MHSLCRHTASEQRHQLCRCYHAVSGTLLSSPPDRLSSNAEAQYRLHCAAAASLPAPAIPHLPGLSRAPALRLATSKPAGYFTPIPLLLTAPQYGVVNEEYIIKVPKARAPDGLQLDDRVSDYSVELCVASRWGVHPPCNLQKKDRMGDIQA